MTDYAAPVIELHEGSKNTYKLNLRELEKILGSKAVVNKKVVLISIAGAFRKGKSFLLNFFVHYLEWLHKGGTGDWFDENTTLDKFHWRGGSKRDTNGIFLWNVPYILEDKNGEEVVVLLMDTQGSFDHQSTVHDCATIFALSTLLSSVQIFNLSGQIQEDNLNYLRLFTEYANLAKDENQESQAPFQKLLFLVRDWPHPREHSYGYGGGQKYLNELLKTSPKQKKELQSLRNSIKRSFEVLEAFLMPHPGLRIANDHSEKVLGDVEPEFEEHLNAFVPSLFEEGSLKAKTIGGKPITCGELLELFKSYMTIFNSDDLPEPKTILEAAVDAMNISYEQKAKEAYEKFMSSKMEEHPNLADLSVLNGYHKKAEAESLNVFASRPKLGGEEFGQDFEDRILSYTKTRLSELKKMVEHNVRVIEEKKRVEAERKRLLEEQEAERQRIKAQEERLRREREEQERRQREEAERLRRQREEHERKQREQAERFRRQREEQERQRLECERRQREQAEKLRRQWEEQERERLEYERKRREKEQKMREEQERTRREMERQQREHQEQMRREREAEEKRAREERARCQRQQEEARRMMEMAREESRGVSYSPFSGWGGYCPSVSSYSERPSFGGGSGNMVSYQVRNRDGSYRTVYRDTTTGRFAKNPNS